MTRDQRNTFIASFLGWTLDAFDYFLVVVVIAHIADDFKTTVAHLAIATTLTLALRPLGALIFGYIADRYGRRTPLMVDIALYSLIELLTAFSPNITVFFVLRAIYGIAMGGEWGLGAAMAMEALPAQRRGLFSGILQEGYAVGNLLAGIALGVLYPLIGWRGMFVVGALPALLIFYIRSRVPESPVWKAGQAARLSESRDVLLASIARSWPLFVYAILFMAAFNFMSHGTQDAYATFLGKQHGFSPQTIALINTIASIGAILGGVAFGAISQRFGRRNAILVCAVVGAAFIPLWAFSHTVALLALGGFLMQFVVQGAWGIIPAHLNEISPSSVRGTFPGFTYQLGNLIAAGTLQIEATMAQAHPLPNGAPNYSAALSHFMIWIFAGVAAITLIGYFVVPERRGADFSALPSE